MDFNQLADSLEPEEKHEIELWQRGKNLLAIPPHAQDEILAMLEGYVRSDADDLLATHPKEEKEVLAKHAVAYASALNLVRFQQDWAQAVTAAHEVPQALRARIRGASEVPPESL